MSVGTGAGPSKRRVGRVSLPDAAALQALYHSSLSRRLLFLKTQSPPPFGSLLELVLTVSQPACQVSLGGVVRFVADAHAPKGAGCGVEISETKEVIAARVEQAIGPLPAYDDKAPAPKVSVEVLFDGVAPIPATTNPNQRKALVVDDDPDLQKVYVRLLEPAGFQVVVAKDGLLALELFKQQHFSLVVLDYLLPRLDGIKVAEEILKIRKLPLLFCSAVTRDQQMANRLRSLGVGWIVEKPFRLEHLRRAFDEAIHAALGLDDG